MLTCRKKRSMTIGHALAGVNDGEVPPVPIPNTEVKLLSADGTWWATAWESRT